MQPLKINLNNLHFVIVEPRNAGNIGSICRACKNMGIKNITLVNSCEFTDETHKLAWGAEDTIASIRHVKTYEEALDPMQWAVGTTQRLRGTNHPSFEPRELMPQIAELTQSNSAVAFVFGRENNGLSNDELLRCNVISTIPSFPTQPVLNLSQAVMIYAYEAFLFSTDTEKRYEWQLAKSIEREKMFLSMEKAVESLPIDTRKGSAAFVSLFKRVLNRTPLEERDVRLFFKLFQLIQEAKHDTNS